MPLRFPDGDVRFPFPLNVRVPVLFAATGSCTTFPEVEKLVPEITSVLPPAPTLTEALAAVMPSIPSCVVRSAAYVVSDSPGAIAGAVIVADAPPAVNPEMVRFVEESTVPTAFPLCAKVYVLVIVVTGGFPAVLLTEVGVSVSGSEIL